MNTFKCTTLIASLLCFASMHGSAESAQARIPFDNIRQAAVAMSKPGTTAVSGSISMHYNPLYGSNFKAGFAHSIRAVSLYDAQGNRIYTSAVIPQSLSAIKAQCSAAQIDTTKLTSITDNTVSRPMWKRLFGIGKTIITE